MSFTISFLSNGEFHSQALVLKQHSRPAERVQEASTPYTGKP